MGLSAWEVTFVGSKKNEKITKRFNDKQKAKRVQRKNGGTLVRISRA